MVNNKDELKLIAVKILINVLAFIRIIFHKRGGGCLLEATVFDYSWKNLKMFKFSSIDLLLISERKYVLALQRTWEV